MMTAAEALAHLRDAQESAARSGRDFGRGYAYALSLLADLLAEEDAS